MKAVLLIALVICIANCRFQEQEDRAQLLLTRYALGYNNADWGLFASTLTKDIKIGGANSPLFEGRENYVDAAAALYPTNLKLGFHGENIQLGKEIGYMTGYYTYYYPNKEQEILEVGQYVCTIKKSEEGIWQFQRILFNKLENEYSIAPEFWRKM